MTDTITRAPRGTNPVYLAASSALFESLLTLPAKSRRDVAKAVYKRLGASVKAVAKDGTWVLPEPPGARKAAVAKAIAAKSEKAAGATKGKKAAAPKRAPIRTKPVLSRGQATPKSSLTASGKKRGRPFGVKNKPKVPAQHEVPEVIDPYVPNGRHEEWEQPHAMAQTAETHIPQDE